MEESFHCLLYVCYWWDPTREGGLGGLGCWGARSDGLVSLGTDLMISVSATRSLIDGRVTSRRETA